MSDELTNHLHAMSSLEIVELMNEQDSTVAEVVQGALPEIARAVDLISKKINIGGRLFYLGCLLYTSPSPRDRTRSRMPSSA